MGIITEFERLNFAGVEPKLKLLHSLLREQVYKVAIVEGALRGGSGSTHVFVLDEKFYR